MSRTLTLVPLCFVVAACSATATSTEDGSSDEELRKATPVVELALDAQGKCATRTPKPRVKYRGTVRLKNVGDRPIAALVHLWDHLGGMPAPEGGDIEPGKTISVKMSTKWWVLNDDPDSREWSTEIVCRKGPWADSDADFDEVGTIDVYR